MLRTTNITYAVAGRELISDVSVSFAAGQLHLIVGPNGAGKSTLIKLLARLLRPQSGVVEYEGLDVSRTSELDLARCRAVLSQAVEVAFPLDVREVVMMGRYPHFGGRPGPVDEKVVDEMIALFDLREFEDRNYQTLSGGERQRVNFARVLGQLWHTNDGHAQTGPRYLFLDEPLTFLDIRHQIEFMKRVKEFSSAPDVIVVGVVHDLSLAARFADHIVVLDRGRIADAGEPDRVLTAERIKEVFEVEPRFVLDEHAGRHIVFD